eukprot:COSAG02_NODE_43252_length_376_cov_1.299639_1_plen_75_part_00
MAAELEQITVRTPAEKAADERAEAKARSDAEKAEIQRHELTVANGFEKHLFFNHLAGTGDLDPAKKTATNGRIR